MVIILMVAALFLSACEVPEENIAEKIAFAECLTEKGAEMYGAYWCVACKRQKGLFGKEALKKINYIECDAKGPNGNPDLCAAKNILSFPTWIFADGSMNSEVMTLAELAEKTGCIVPRSGP